MTRLHTINYWRLRHRENIRAVSITAICLVIAAMALYGAYFGIGEVIAKYDEADILRKDNHVAMQMLSGERFVVDGAEYRMEEVKQLKLVGGL